MKHPGTQKILREYREYLEYLRTYEKIKCGIYGNEN